MEHPEVFAARQRYDSLRSESIADDLARENRTAIDTISRQLEDFRQRAMGVLGPVK